MRFKSPPSRLSKGAETEVWVTAQTFVAGGEKGNRRSNNDLRIISNPSEFSTLYALPLFGLYRKCNFISLEDQNQFHKPLFLFFLTVP
jgi:hypothetical protein